MRPLFTRIVVVIVAVIVLYFILRASMTSRASETDVPADTMCFASRIGLPCNDPG